jgi:hypothetical protein
MAGVWERASDQRQCCTALTCCLTIPIVPTPTQGVGLRFEAEATGWLQAQTVPTTNDAPKYAQADVTATVLAILTPGGCS